MNKEGHLSVVKNTREPIKPSYEKPIQSYNNEYSAYNQPETKKTNYDALSPMKRSNTISRKEGIILLVISLIFWDTKLFTVREAFLIKSNIEGNNLKNSFEMPVSVNDRIVSSHSLSPNSHGDYRSSLNFRSSFQLQNAGKNKSLIFLFEFQ